MKVFISSVIGGMGEFRQTAKEAVTTLRYEPSMAEDFAASPHSPQIACLRGVRQADIIILLLGADYGAIQPSGLSATHEEYREARNSKPVFAFVQTGIVADSKQIEFIHEVEGWQGGVFRMTFHSPSNLRIGVTRSLHEYAMANAVGPLNSEELQARSIELISKGSRRHSGMPSIQLAIIGGPIQQILRPIEIEDAELKEALYRESLLGPSHLFDRSSGVETKIADDCLVLEQERGEAKIVLDERGSLFMSLPIQQSGRSLPEIIEETVSARISAALEFGSGVIERIDSSQKLTDVAVSMKLSDADYLGWRTQAESDASPNRAVMSMGSGGKGKPISVVRKRSAIKLDRIRLVEDLLVPLRRQWK